MGVHPREVLKQIMQMNSDGMGEEEEGEEDGNHYGEEMDDDQIIGDNGAHSIQNNHNNHGDESMAREEQLRLEKELFKMQMGLAGSDKKKQPSAAKVAPEQHKIQPSQAPQA